MNLMISWFKACFFKEIVTIVTTTATARTSATAHFKISDGTVLLVGEMFSNMLPNGARGDLATMAAEIVIVKRRGLVHDKILIMLAEWDRTESGKLIQLPVFVGR